MLNNLLKVSEELQAQGYPKFINIGEAAIYALLGFIVVFLGITFLIFIVWVVGKLMNSFANKPKKEKKVTEEPAPAPTQSVVQETEEISEETVAVITAAIMAYYVKENRKCEFTVKRIKRL